jgi:alcohol dehydrogenase class IV
VETYCSPVVNPPADAISLDGMQRIFAHLERAVRDGSDREARWNMMMGSLEGAISFQKGMGAVHALSHPLGARGFHHGTLNAILLPHVVACNRQALGAKWTVMAGQAGWSPDADPRDAFSALNARIGIPPRLSSIGVSEAVLEAVAAEALEDNAHKTNPRALTQADYLRLLHDAF